MRDAVGVCEGSDQRLHEMEMQRRQEGNIDVPFEVPVASERL